MQITADKAHGQAQAACGLHEQMRKVAAGTGTKREGFLCVLHTGFLAHPIGEGLMDMGTETLQQGIGLNPLPWTPYAGDPIRQQSVGHGVGDHIRRQYDPVLLGIGKRVVLRVVSHQEIVWGLVVLLDDDLALDGELAGE